jgi:hypothetical protein
MRRLVRDMMAWWRKANKEAVEAARNQVGGAELWVFCFVLICLFC